MPANQFDTRVAAYAVIVDERQRVLLALWNGEGRTAARWTMPGGGVELDETIEEAAVREVSEETGYDIELGRVLGIHCHTVAVEHRLRGEPRPLKGVRVVYDARIVGGSLTHESHGTTDEARWVPLRDVASLDRVELVDAAIGFWRSSPDDTVDVDASAGEFEERPVERRGG